jgi:hypothetical protein
MPTFQLRFPQTYCTAARRVPRWLRVPRTTPAIHTGYTGAFADPDGYVWEVAHNPDWTLANDGTIQLP